MQASARVLGAAWSCLRCVAKHQSVITTLRRPDVLGQDTMGAGGGYASQKSVFLRVVVYQKAAVLQRSRRGDHVMAVGVTNLGVVLVLDDEELRLIFPKPLR